LRQRESNGDGQRQRVLRTVVGGWFGDCGLAMVWMSSVSPGLAFDATLFLCSLVGSLFRMKFWGAKNLNRFRVLRRITFEGEATGCTATDDCTSEGVDDGPLESLAFYVSAKKKE
jgi:hypothetical protein